MDDVLLPVLSLSNNNHGVLRQSMRKYMSQRGLSGTAGRGVRAAAKWRVGVVVLEDCRDVAIIITAGQGIPPCWSRTPGRSRGGGGGSTLRSHFYHAASIMAFCSPPAIVGVRTGRRHQRRRQSTRDRRRTHRAPSPAPSAVHQQSQACVQGAVTGAVGSAFEVAGVGARRRHRRRQESLPHHAVSESARSVADCRPPFDTCRSSEGWMCIP